jgi:hypothetical protein
MQGNFIGKTKNMKRFKPSGFLKKNILTESSAWGAGTCLTCIQDFSFCEHRKEEEIRSKRLSCLIAETAISSEEQRLERIAARNEFETDEFLTWKQKAQNQIKSN